jgi:mannosylglycerate hydrolase
MTTLQKTGSQSETSSPATFHFVPNTHWDREWLYDFQETRMFLVEFMDRLLNILAEHSEYKTYLLDSQTVLLEDYLQIRPDRHDEIVQRVKEKRLFIGPWYTLPEEHLVNGESLVRNLLLGGRVAEKLGGSMQVGYSPFSYGQASQMPQIYAGFGIDSILFYHGIHPRETPSEFLFEGADGTRLFASRMGSNARYNFFFSVYRPAVYGKQALERNYHWQEQGLPFHLCSDQHYQEHHILLDPIKELRKDRLAELMEALKQAEREHVTTDQICCMQGMDSTQPDVYELRCVEEAAKVLTDDTIFHSSLPEWLDAVKKAVDWDELTVLKGERRTPRQLGTRVHLYGDVTSTRVRIKQHNGKTEQQLQRMAEPFAAVASLLGAEYPVTTLELAWKYLLKSQPHDTIAGTGVDQIELDVHHRLDQSYSIAQGVKRRALWAIQRQIDNGKVDAESVVLTLFNPAPVKRSEVVTAIVDLPAHFDLGHYRVVDAQTGQTITFQEAGRWEHPAIVRHLGDATMEMPALRVRLHLAVDDVPGLGYQTLLVEPAEQFGWHDKSLVGSANCMENEHVRVAIQANGTLNLTDKTSGQTFNGLHYFADNGEAGHAWRHIPPCHDRVITTHSSTPKIDQPASGPLVARYAITHTMDLPKRLDQGMGDPVRRLDADGDDASRSEETETMVIRSELRLDRESRGVEIITSLENRCEDHRLRVMFPTHVAATHSSAEEPFDVVERPIERGPESPWQGTWNPTHPFQRFVDVSDGQKGLALLGDGLREYEVTEDASRTIGLTLLRAFEVALTTVAWRWERHPEMKGSQVLGNHQFRYFLYPHAGDWDQGRVAPQADRFLVPLEPVQTQSHAGTLPQSLSFLELEPAELLVSSIKQAERCQAEGGQAEGGQALVIRLYNPSSRAIDGSLTLFKKPQSVQYVNLNEEPTGEADPVIQDNQITLAVGAKKIVTLEIVFE